jgi:co-chaperonin GroES (HSP10)
MRLLRVIVAEVGEEKRGETGLVLPDKEEATADRSITLVREVAHCQSAATTTAWLAEVC